MKRSRKSVRTKAASIPELRFEDQRLTSFAGLVVIQRFFQVIGFKARLQKCFRHLSQGKTFDRATIFMQLVIHVLLGFRELRDAAHYHDDPLVQRVLGLKHLPDVATISRMLKEADQRSVSTRRQGSVAKSTHAGLPWLSQIRNEVGDRVHFWPFDGWDVPHGKSVLAEIYPSIFRNRYPKDDRTNDQHDAYCVARWLTESDQRGILNRCFAPPLTDDERAVADLEGWILGIC